MDCKMLTKLLQRYPRINNRVVEPAEDQIVQYKALAQSRAHELRGVSFDWRQQTIQQYEEAGDATKFNFISAIHSIYYVDDVDSSLMYLFGTWWHNARYTYLRYCFSDDTQVLETK